MTDRAALREEYLATARRYSDAYAALKALEPDALDANLEAGVAAVALATRIDTALRAALGAEPDEKGAVEDFMLEVLEEVAKLASATADLVGPDEPANVATARALLDEAATIAKRADDAQALVAVAVAIANLEAE